MIKLKWEEGYMEIPLPEKSEVNWLEPTCQPPFGQAAMAVNIRNDLKKIAADLKNALQLVLIIEDPSRASITNELAALICKGIKEIRGHLQGFDMIIAAGAHYQIRQEDLQKKTPLNLDLPVEIHDCADNSNLEAIGVSKSGYPLIFNKKVVHADLRLSISTVNIHPLAGFSGGGKILLPGVAGVETIRALHSLPPGNPGDDHSAMRKLINEVLSMLPILFSWHLLSNPDGIISDICSGETETSRRAAISKLEKTAFFPRPDKKAGLLLMGCRPFNINLLGTFKSVHQIPKLLEPGGTAILFNEAAQGVGCHHWRNDPEVVAAQKENFAKLLNDFKVGVFSPQVDADDFNRLFPASFSLLKMVDDLKSFIYKSDCKTVFMLPFAPVTLIL